MPFGHLFQDIPDFRCLALNHLLGAPDRMNITQLFQPPNDERFKQNQRHLFRQAALMQFEFWADDDNRTPGVIDSLTEKVLPEPATLAFKHVAQRLERTVARTGYGATVSAVVEQRVDRFLEHPFFIPNNDVWRLELEQVL